MNFIVMDIKNKSFLNCNAINANFFRSVDCDYLIFLLNEDIIF